MAQKMRDTFHDVLGKLNTITVAAGTAAEMIRMDMDDDETDVVKLKKKLTDALKALGEAEDAAMAVSMDINKLKTEVYGLLNIDVKQVIDKKEGVSDEP